MKDRAAGASKSAGFPSAWGRQEPRHAWKTIAVSTLIAAASVRAELVLRVESGGRFDTLVTSNLFLRVPAGGTPSPFLVPGPFHARWEGNLEAELRGEAQFRATGTGKVKLRIRDALVFDGIVLTEGRATEWSEPVRLRKGLNALEVSFDGATNSGSGLRIEWRGRGIASGPIPEIVLKAPPEVPSTGQESEAARRGRGHFLEFRCGRCHGASGNSGPAVPELSAEAPSFEDIGRRLSQEWMTRWIEAPRSLRPDATMPRLVGGARAREEASAMAAWLSTLGAPTKMADEKAGNAAVGRALFGSLHCDACHSAPGAPRETEKISLTGLGAKFLPGALAAFLHRPAAHAPWTRMPDFGLSTAEAAHLAAWLRSVDVGEGGRSAVLGPRPVESATAEQGKRLVEERGCLRCHSGPATDRSRAPALVDLAGDRWTSGCLSESGTGVDAGRALVPRYDFGSDIRAELRALGALDRMAVTRHVPTEFAERWTERLRCGSCHGNVEGLPLLAHSGEKLRPEWTRKLLRGEVSPKSRPWLAARMPGFPAFASALAEGMAGRHGLPAASPPEGPVDEAAAEVGRRMVSAAGGFSCVTCHAVGPAGASAVFEAPGINLAWVGERLLPEYFERWVRNPQAIEPSTKMPLYFDEEGNSALSDFYGGDGPKTIHALWSYIRKGPNLPPPPVAP